MTLLTLLTNTDYSTDYVTLLTMLTSYNTRPAKQAPKGSARKQRARPLPGDPVHGGRPHRRASCHSLVERRLLVVPQLTAQALGSATHSGRAERAAQGPLGGCGAAVLPALTLPASRRCTTLQRWDAHV